jgi:hypothetical protein
MTSGDMNVFITDASKAIYKVVDATKLDDYILIELAPLKALSQQQLLRQS